MLTSQVLCIHSLVCAKQLAHVHQCDMHVVVNSNRLCVLLVFATCIVAFTLPAACDCVNDPTHVHRPTVYACSVFHVNGATVCHLKIWVFLVCISVCYL